MPTQFTYESLADVQEGDLVGRILDETHWRERFLNIRGIPSSPVCIAEVLTSDLGLTGDIDLLVLAQGQPECATAIQVKRIKVSDSTFETGKPNKLAALPELYRQTNALVRLGFWQVFSYVVVVVDSRLQNVGSNIYNGLTHELKEHIQSAIRTDGLHEKAGLIKAEFVQSMDDRPLGAGTFHAQLIRPAIQAEQPTRITDWVKRKVASSDA